MLPETRRSYARALVEVELWKVLLAMAETGASAFKPGIDAAIRAWTGADETPVPPSKKAASMTSTVEIALAPESSLKGGLDKINNQTFSRIKKKLEKMERKVDDALSKARKVDKLMSQMEKNVGRVIRESITRGRFREHQDRSDQSNWLVDCIERHFSLDELTNRARGIHGEHIHIIAIAKCFNSVTISQKRQR